MIELRDFSIGYDGKPLIENVSTTFSAEKLTSMIGRNGSGKSTLIRALCGINTKYEGDILINGRNLRNIPVKEMATMVSFVNTQRPRIANMRCRDIVALGRSPYTDWIGRLSPKDAELVDYALKNVGMSQFSERTLQSLSDGECQRVMIARAIAQDTSIIILDEPTSFLDLPTRYEIVSLLRDLAHDKKKTVIFSTHELDIAEKMSDDISLLTEHTLINLPVDEMNKSGHISRLFSLPF